MARLRNRMLKADFWGDGDLLRWPREKRFTYAGLFSLAEDSGVLEDDVFTWKFMIWPSPLDADITVEKLTKWRDELVADDKLVPYTAGADNLLFIKSFHEHEHPRNPQSPALALPPWVTFVPADKTITPQTRAHYDVVGEPGQSLVPAKKPAAKATEVAKSNGKDDGSFDVFYAFYPRRAGRHKCEIAWSHLTRAERELATGVAQIMGALHDNGQMEEQYIKLPLTFLHGKNWEDWREGVPAEWRDSSQERAAQQTSTLEAALAAMTAEEAS
jgi:hypothetical protein